jgi:mono/diheme cytochrome c family protein
MKKLLVLSCICAAGIISCGKKVVPESGANNPSKSENEKTTKSSSKSGSENVASTTAPSFNNMKQATPPDQGASRSTPMDKGKTLYITKCSGCHTIKNPSDYTQEQTLNFLRVEIPKAKLSSKEADAVTAYMLENSKK